MKIAIPTAQGKLCMHFGHCEVFTVFDVNENKQVKETNRITPPPHEPGVLPKWLGELGVDVIIASGMGMRAQQLFAQNGVKVVVGADSDTPENVISAYLNDTLVTGENACDH
ncbi:MAG: NifB/NifX family molybdenum-iron cluster-binding protein [Victivallales bacterium]|nr:NifB/NifX family molybdenum-iron cluster-binding protein [Victivallales bacterium]